MERVCIACQTVFLTVGRVGFLKRCPDCRDGTNAPVCACGCGQKVAWSNIKKQWCQYVTGHHSKVSHPRGSLGKTFHRPKQKTSQPCQKCGVLFEVYPSQKARKFCSIKCRGEFYSGEKSHTWTGGNWRNTGYASKTTRGVATKVHRIKVSKFMGRPLKKREVVHHVDNDPTNNSIKNLFLFHCARCHLHFHKSKASPLKYKYRDFHERLRARKIKG